MSQTKISFFIFFQNQSALDKESRKLEKMQQEEENGPSEDAIHLQEEKRERLAYELENLAKEVALEQDKLTSTLLTLVRQKKIIKF